MGYKTVQEVISLLKEHDFKLLRQKGSHMVFKGNGRTVVVPNHGGGIEKGTCILREAGLK